MSAAVMLDEVMRLGGDLPELVAAADRQLADRDVLRRLGGVRRAILTGCGDSLHAAWAAGPAFSELAACPAEIVGPQAFVADCRRGASEAVTDSTLLVGISASGGTPPVVEALRGARALGMRTLALTGRSGSAAAAAAEAAVVVDVAAPVPSPGIRTFQASLVSLFILAGRMAGIRGVGDDRGHREWCQEIVATGRALRATVEAAAAAARAVAEETARAPVSMMLASGRHLGIARYAAAKRIEASGLFAAAQDLEEWWHVERFAYPADMPVTIIAPPGATVALAAETALKARGLGRRVVAVCAEDTAGIRAHAHTILPIAASVREALSPLVSHPALTLVAAHEALILGRRPFQRDHPEFRERLQAYQAAFPDGS